MSQDQLDRLLDSLNIPQDARQSLVSFFAQSAVTGASFALDGGGEAVTVLEDVEDGTLDPDLHPQALRNRSLMPSQNTVALKGEQVPMPALASSPTASPSEEAMEVSVSTGPVAPSFGVGSRYEVQELIGQGGMGEVWRVRDGDLGRTLALKTIRAELVENQHAVARFIEEAQVGAQLQHPGLVPVYEIGTLPDGRYYFTMQEIRGRLFTEAIAEVHRTSNGVGRWATSPGGWSLQRLVRVFARVCEAVGYAHTRGVVHCDIKPANIVVGQSDAIFVLDWGVARILGRQIDSEEDDIETHRTRNAELATRAGTVRGTPQYMAPEQAAGQLERLSPRTDVYSLGIILYELLSGLRPRRQNGLEVLEALLAGEEPMPVQDVALLQVPDELAELCAWAMSHDPEARPADARELAAVAHEWLEGTRRRQRAMALLEEAQATQEQAEQMRIIADALDKQSAVLLGTIEPNAPEVVKYPAWTLEDEARSKRQQAALREVDAELRLQAALTHEPTLEESHMALALRYERHHRAAIESQDDAEAQRAEIYLRTHLDALAPAHFTRQRLESYLKGTGALTLLTDPPGAEVMLYTYETQNRRLVPVFVRSLGRTPIVNMPLPAGSHLLVLRKEGHQEVRYPVCIERQAHWKGIRPGASEPTPVWLPPLGSLGADECYVPAGFYLTQGPQTVPGVRKRQWIWVDAFVTRRFPVTHAQYLAFINTLAGQERHEDIRRWAPQERSGGVEELGPMLYGLDEETGRYTLKPDSDGDLLSQQTPVTLVDFSSALAFAGWLAQSSGKPWRLMVEDEWEKAARGVDGRSFPWGEFHDPSRSHMLQSHSAKGQGMIAEVDTYPTDVSPYGVRGAAGNSMDWTVDSPRVASLPKSRTVEEIVLASLEEGEHVDHVIRGGAWVNNTIYCHLSRRHYSRPSTRLNFLGLRVARSV